MMDGNGARKMTKTIEETNKALGLEAFDTLFNKRTTRLRRDTKSGLDGLRRP